MYLRAPTPTQIEAIKRISEISSDVVIEATEAQDPAFVGAGQSTDGILYFDYGSEGVLSFVENFESRYSSTPGLPAKLAYDAVYSLSRALDNKEITTDNIIKGLSDVSFDGASGSVRFDKDQNRVVDLNNLNLYEKREGAFVEVSR